MQLFKQNEATFDLVLQMSIALCDEYPGSPDCKRYMHWLRLNAPESTNDNEVFSVVDSVPFDRVFDRSRAEEIFW